MEKLSKAVIMITQAISLTAAANIVSIIILVVTNDIGYLPIYSLPILMMLPPLITSIKFGIASKGSIKIMTKHLIIVLSLILSVLLFMHTPKDIEEIYNTYGEYIVEFNESFDTIEDVKHNLNLMSLPNKYSFIGTSLVKAVEAEFDAKSKVEDNLSQLYEDTRYFYRLRDTLNKQSVIVLFYSYVINLIGIGIFGLVNGKVIKEIK